MYRPPHSEEKEFLKDYRQLTTILTQHKDMEVVIGMDHNLDFLKASKHTNTQEFLDYNIDINLWSVITKPTRITDTSATLIDNILIIRGLQHDYNSGLMISDMSDHLPTWVKLKSTKQEIRQHQLVTYRKFNEKNIEAMNEELKVYNWDDQLHNTGTEEAYQILHGIVLDCMNKHMPTITKKTMKKDQCNEPWITKGIKRSIDKQKQLYKKLYIRKQQRVILQNKMYIEECCKKSKEMQR